MKDLKVLILSLLSLLLTSCGNSDNKNIISATGNIEATFITLSSKVAGEILQINFKEGSSVNAGDTILIIDDEILRLQLLQAAAARESAEAQLDLLRSGSRSEDVSQAKAIFNQAKIGLEQAEKDKARMTKLLESNAITKKQFEDVKVKYEVVQSQYNAAKENLNKIKNIARPEDLKKAEAALNQTLANEKLIKKNINDCYVKSPISGFVVEHFYEQNETVSPMASLLKVADLKEVNLDIYINELDLPNIQLNQKVAVFVDAFENKSFNGRVVYISPESEFTPKNIQTPDERTKLVYKVKVKIDNPEFLLKSGMPADAEITLDDRNN